MELRIRGRHMGATSWHFDGTFFSVEDVKAASSQRRNNTSDFKYAPKWIRKHVLEFAKTIPTGEARDRLHPTGIHVKTHGRFAKHYFNGCDVYLTINQVLL